MKDLSNQHIQDMSDEVLKIAYKKIRRQMKLIKLVRKSRKPAPVPQTNKITPVVQNFTKKTRDDSSVFPEVWSKELRSLLAPTPIPRSTSRKRRLSQVINLKNKNKKIK